MDVAPELAQGALRFSLDARENTAEDVDRVVAAVAEVAATLRKRRGWAPTGPAIPSIQGDTQ